jgi:hypothetical protein
VINPGGPKSEEGTPFSVSDIIAKETEELLEMATNDHTYGKQQGVLKALVRCMLFLDMCYQPHLSVV